MGTPQLNIKDAETTRLVRELAALTGETQTEVVRKALRERLQREKAEREAADARTAEEKRREFERVWAKIQKIQDSVRRRGLSKNMLTDDDLYDANGLPK
jgi:antitoxin VapB